MYKLFKLLIIIEIFVFFVNQNVNSQNVSISDIDRLPNSSAVLDIFSSNKGLLIPNVALTGTTDISTISSPAISLIIYNTASVNDVTPGFYYWNGSLWLRFLNSNFNFTNAITESSGIVKLGGDLIENTSIIQDATENFSILNNGAGLTLIELTSSGDFQIKANIDTLYNNSAFYVRNDGNVGIGNSNPTYKLQIDGVTQGSNKSVMFVRNLDGTNSGSSSIFATINPNTSGTNWGLPYAKAGIKGYISNGYHFTAGVAGYKYDNDSINSAGVLGAASTINPSVWGALGYKGYKYGPGYADSICNYAAYLHGKARITDDLLLEGEYVNFDTTYGEFGYGIRDRDGTLEYKNFGGSWNPLPLPPPAGASTEWWYKPSGKNWIQPISNNNIRIYDAGQDTGFYYNGATNKIAGFFRTTSGLDGTTAVQGFSDVANKKTYGYLGYNGEYRAVIKPNDTLIVEGSAIYGVVEDPSRVSIFGRTTGNATYSAIIGYSDSWISGYFSAKDSSGTNEKARPALYAQMITTEDKESLESSVAIKGFSEFTETGNSGYTVGGQFIALGNYQDTRGVEIYSTTDPSVNSAENIGIDIMADNGNVVYGVYSTAGDNSNSTESYGVWTESYAKNGTGIVAAGNNITPVYLTGGSGASFIGEEIGIYSKHSAITTAGTGYIWQNTGTAAIIGNSPHSGREIPNTSMYQFGIVGQKNQDYSGSYYYDLQSGGVLGSLYRTDNTTTMAWGSLGYLSSATPVIAYYGVYGTTSTTGTGKSENSLGVGVAGYGDLFGSWFRGEVYGSAIKGDRMSLYVDGKTYTTEVISQLVETETEVIPTYVTSSMTADIYMKGVGQLVDGKANIKFDEDYFKIISQTEPVIVTITPIGKCNGVYLEEIKSNGFSVSEIGDAKSNVKFTWIAVATRKDCENIDNPEEILSVKFDDNLDKFMFNENNSEQNAASLWWDGTKLRTDEISKTESNNDISTLEILRETKTKEKSTKARNLNFSSESEKK